MEAKSIFEKSIIDKDGDKHRVIISFDPENEVNINAYLNGEHSGFLTFYIDEANRAILDRIYTFYPYRNKEVGSKLLSIAEEYAVSLGCEVMIGIFKPFFMGNDITYNRNTDEVDLRKSACGFYTANGYQVIEYDTYIKNQDKYVSVKEEYFKPHGFMVNTIIYKKVQVKKDMIRKRDFITYE